jgi:predicted oxidoreductase
MLLNTICWKQDSTTHLKVVQGYVELKLVERIRERLSITTPCFITKIKFPNQDVKYYEKSCQKKTKIRVSLKDFGQVKTK